MFIINILDIIAKKCNGKALSKKEIDFFTEQCAGSGISDIHISAFLTACFINKISKDELMDFAISLSATGQSLDSSAVGLPTVDVCCTGAVGDKTDFILTPLLACAGVNVIKNIDGGFGTFCASAEKFRCINGLRTEFSRAELLDILEKFGGVFCSSSDFIVPAEKRILSVMNQMPVISDLSLITACIIGRKLAVSSDAFVFDFKYGSGAVFPSYETAELAAREVISALNSFGKKAVAAVSPLDEPIGRALGFQPELCEAVDTLKGHGPDDLTERCFSLAARAIVLLGREKNYDSAYSLVREILFSGRAMFKFNSIVSAQGGCTAFLKKSFGHDSRPSSTDIKADSDGYVWHIDSGKLGQAARCLAFGKDNASYGSPDYSSGLVLHKKTGDHVSRGESLATVYYNSEYRFDYCKELIATAYEFSSSPFKLCGDKSVFIG